MPGTAHALAGNETLGQRAVIMGAMGADSEDFAAALHQQHLLVADMAEELAVNKIRQRDALGEVRALRRVLLLRHRYAPTLWSCVRSIMPRNCRRSSASSREHPSMRLVTRLLSGLWTPRVVMQ